LPPPLELVAQSEARSAVHRLWSLESWSYLHSSRGHSIIMVRLQQSDPIFNMGIDVIRSAFNFEPKNREEWTRGTGTPPVIKGLVWFTGGSRMSVLICHLQLPFHETQSRDLPNVKLMHNIVVCWTFISKNTGFLYRYLAMTLTM